MPSEGEIRLSGEGGARALGRHVTADVIAYVALGPRSLHILLREKESSLGVFRFAQKDNTC